MLFNEIYQTVRSELRLYTAIATFTPREFMRWAQEAQQVMQERTDYIENVMRVDIPANAGSLTNPVPLSIRIRHLKGVQDDSMHLRYGVREYEYFKNVLMSQSPVANSQRQIPPMPFPYYNDPDTAYCAVEGRMLYVFPVPSQDTVLTLQYVPMLAEFSADDPQFASWNMNSTDDTAFNAAWSSTSIEREFIPFYRAVAEFVKSKFLWGIPNDKDATMKAQRADAEFEKQITIMRQNKTSNARQVTAHYHMNS